MNVTLLNIAEGTYTVADTTGRSHSFPCGHMGDIDLPDAYVRMFAVPNSRSAVVIVPADADLPERFMAMLHLLRAIHELSYNEVLQQSGIVLGKNATKLRPKVGEIRDRLRKLALSFVMAGFKGFDLIMANEDARDPEDSTMNNPDALDAEIRETEARVNRTMMATPNVPRYMRAQFAEQREAEALMTGDPSSDPRAREAVILGRVPTPNARTLDSARPVRIVSEVPSALPAAPIRDIRTAEEIAADIDASAEFDADAAIDESEVELDNSPDGDDTVEVDPRDASDDRPARKPRPLTHRAPTAPTVRKKAKAKPARKAASAKQTKRGSRR